MGVSIKNVFMKFGNTTVLKDINIDILQGEFFSILGPSGCGKTTLLKIISGFLEQTSGEVHIYGEDMSGVDANKRPTSLIFQNLALFPNMSVKENIAFGLDVKQIDSKTIEKKVNKLLNMISLEEYKDSMIDDLSGGQKQRVAIARALAVEPKVLLLDEPLSALDLKLRQHMRRELRDLQKLTGVTFIYITHDQGEALAMSDKVAVMSKGVIEQISTPQELYNNPRTPFVASFVGENNEFNGEIIEKLPTGVLVKTLYGNFKVKSKDSLQVGTNVKLFIRPERFSFIEVGAKSQKPRDNSIILDINSSSFEGAMVNIYLKRDKNDLIKKDIMIHKKNSENLSSKLSASLKVFFDDHDILLLET